MKKITRAINTRPEIKNAKAIVTPVFQTSAFEADSDYFYTRKNNPNIEEFENAVAILEESSFCLATTTGMSAIHLVLSLLEYNNTIVVNKDIYGCSYKLFQKSTEQLNINIIILDLSVKSNIEKIPGDCSMVFFETPTNPFLKTVNIRSVVKKVKARNSKCLVVVDNTWATPLFQQPLKHGADISLHSATKYFSGHSDVMGGCILLENNKLYEKLSDLRFYHGNILAPYSAWLLRRSIHTLEIRLQKQGVSTISIRDFLEKRKDIVSEIFYPLVDKKQLLNYGTLIFFRLKEPYYYYYHEFTASLELFSTGTGMACISSMVAQPYSGSHASMTPEEKDKMGLDKSLVRLSIGLEPVEDLINDLDKAFNAILTRED